MSSARRFSIMQEVMACLLNYKHSKKRGQKKKAEKERKGEQGSFALKESLNTLTVYVDKCLNILKNFFGGEIERTVRSRSKWSAISPQEHSYFTGRSVLFQQSNFTQLPRLLFKNVDLLFSTEFFDKFGFLFVSELFIFSV